MAILAVVSGHGFGHSVRQIEILNRLPTEIPLCVSSDAPEWFWRAELKRPFLFLTGGCDVGCVQSTSVEVDIAATRAAWDALEADSDDRRIEMAAWMPEEEFRVVVSDVPSLPLAAARDAGIASVCVANFTWADIYAEYGFPVEKLEAEYACADLLLDADLSLPMPYFPRRETIGLVARTGTERRDDLLAHLGGRDDRRLALVYAGNWGMPFAWERLAGFRDWRFLTLTPPPAPVVGLETIDRAWMPHPDLVSSVDVVVAKPGYGMVGECLAAGTPLLYGPRRAFAEFAALDRALTAWPGGLRLDETPFLSVDWRTALDAVPVRGSLTPVPAPGGDAAARRIAALWRERV